MMESKFWQRIVWQRIVLASFVLGSAWNAGALSARAGSTPVVIPTLDSTGTNAGVNGRVFGMNERSFGSSVLAPDGSPRYLVRLREGESTTNLSEGWLITRSSSEPGGFRVDVGQQNAIAMQSIFQQLSPDAKISLGLSDQAPVLTVLPADVRAALTSFRTALEAGTPNSVEIGTSLNNLLVTYGRFASSLKEPLSPELQAFQNELAQLRRRINFPR